MLLLNPHPEKGHPLAPADAATYGPDGLASIEAYLATRDDHCPTPLHSLPGLAQRLGLGAVYVKEEGKRLGLGSFKALGGGYAVARLVQEEAERRLGHPVPMGALASPAVRAIAATMVFACATDGNHGRSVAQGARRVGAQAQIFVHAGVSHARRDAIARFGAAIIGVSGTYDDSVREAARRADAEGWTIVSDTSWPGYERIPALVMQGYTALIAESLRALPLPPTHVFVQSGVGGIAAAVASHLAVVLGEKRPMVIVADPARAACLYESAKAGHPVKVPHGPETIMAMLDCYEPSPLAFRLLSRTADAFMTVEEDSAIRAIRTLATPTAGDPAIVAGESGGVGLAALLQATDAADQRRALGLDPEARVLLIATEGATDPALYEQYVGRAPEAVG